ncbi:hypothetical protein BUALT_Bualt13G0062000 [Buddleja alternifolia]|uniref:Uncharacterized protein n=1 Tax=Buddleja alternifolia TaxID=168488 RepID=A0AAV6WSF6_9LAMI|nr:hypothetical protein BUALT_Bualt13G0062000 [Buddleja alternifolia]
MRDFSSCLSEHATNISETTSCSKNSCISPTVTPSTQNVVVNTYKTVLSNHNHIFITLTWTNTSSQSQSLTILFNDDQSTTIKLNSNSNSKSLVKKSKGAKSIVSHSSKIELHYDLSAARYQSGPEPIDGYYLLISIDSQIALLLGDVPAKKLKIKNRTAKSSLISRQEHFSGRAIYSTRARFCDGGANHEISIRCVGENEGLKCPALSVIIDKKIVIRVKRLQWNFRGNQTIVLEDDDDLVVDLMWNVHDWFHNPGLGLGCAVFMFRSRSGIDRKLWMEEKMVERDEQDKVEFSLMIYAWK